jgi:hypothetical protein
MTGIRIRAAAVTTLFVLAGSACAASGATPPPLPGAVGPAECWSACAPGPGQHVPGSAVTTTPAMSSLTLARLARVGRRTVIVARFGEAAAMRGVTWPSPGRHTRAAQKAGSSGSAA